MMRSPYNTLICFGGDPDSPRDADLLRREHVILDRAFPCLDIEVVVANHDLNAFDESTFSTGTRVANTEWPYLLGKICMEASKDTFFDPPFFAGHRLPAGSTSRDWQSRIVSGDARPLTLFSGFAHLFLVLILTMVPTYGTGGGDRGQSAVTVRLVEQSPDVVPVAETPGFRDAPASMPTLAKRAPNDPNKRNEVLSAPEPAFIERSQSGTKDSASLQDAQAPTLKKDATAQFQKVVKSQTREREPDAVVKDVARVESPHTYDSELSIPSSASPKIIAGGSAGTPGDEYRNKILSAIGAAAFYPKKALMEKVHGETVVTFTVNKSGTLISLSVKKPSGYDVLDNAAITIVKKASRRFPSIPDEFMSDSLSYDVPIIFKKRS